MQLYREKQPEADLLKLDATTIETDRSFDCIYSNKVLHHLSKSDLRYSFTCQQQLLTDGGLLMHSFWYSDKEEESYGFRLLYRR